MCILAASSSVMFHAIILEFLGRRSIHALIVSNDIMEGHGAELRFCNNLGALDTSMTNLK